MCLCLFPLKEQNLLLVIASIFVLPIIRNIAISWTVFIMNNIRNNGYVVSFSLHGR